MNEDEKKYPLKQTLKEWCEGQKHSNILHNVFDDKSWSQINSNRENTLNQLRSEGLSEISKSIVNELTNPKTQFADSASYQPLIDQEMEIVHVEQQSGYACGPHAVVNAYRAVGLLPPKINMKEINVDSKWINEKLKANENPHNIKVFENYLQIKNKDNWEHGFDHVLQLIQNTENDVALIINATTNQNHKTVAHWLTFSIHTKNGHLYPIRVYDSLSRIDHGTTEITCIIFNAVREHLVTKSKEQNTQPSMKKNETKEKPLKLWATDEVKNWCSKHNDKDLLEDMFKGMCGSDIAELTREDILDAFYSKDVKGSVSIPIFNELNELNFQFDYTLDEDDHDIIDLLWGKKKTVQEIEKKLGIPVEQIQAYLDSK